MLITIYNSDGTAKAELSPNDTSTQVKEIQGDNVLSLSFTHHDYIELDVDDFVDFLNERYWMTEKYRPKQNARKEWVYNLKLYGIESRIKDLLVIKTIDNEDEPVFTLTAPPREHVALIVKCMNSGMGNITDWKVGQVDGTENIVIDYFGKYCDEALREVAEKVGAEAWIEGQTVNICRCEHGELIELGYGNGLLSVDPGKANNVKFYTRLYPVGSTRNIDREKYGFARLQLPDGRKYVEVNEDKYGRKDHYEDTTFAGIYPRRIGKVSSIRSEVKTGEGGNPFTIYYFKDNTLNFNPNSYEIGGLVKRVSFQEGSELAGLGQEDNGTYYFEVNFNSDTSEFEIITIWPYDNDIQLPGDKLVPKVGDEYILWNISMPDEYYALAEQELLEAVDQYNAEHALDVSVFKAPTDHVWIEDNEVELSVGQRVRLMSDQYFPETGYRDSRITKITRKVNLPSQMDIEVGDALSRTSMQKMSDSISDAKNYIRSIGESISLPDIIRTGDKTKPTDNNLYSAKRTQQEVDARLSKIKDDRTPHKLSSDKGFEAGNYEPGVSGGMFGMDAGGDSFLEVARMYVRVKAFFEELTIVKSNVLAGKQYITPGGGVKCIKVVETANAWRCYFLSEQDGEKTETKFIINDQAISEVFNAKEGTANKVSNHRYWRLVTAVNNDAYTDDAGNHYGYIDLSKDDSEEDSDIPAVGDEICQLGYQGTDNKERQTAMVFSTVDADAPSIKLYSGINSFSLAGKTVISFGRDPQTGQVYFRLGSSTDTHYLNYNQQNGLEIAGAISTKSTYNGKTLNNYISEATQEAADAAKAELQEKIDTLQNQIDGVLESFNGFGAPTLNNYPANEWTTDAERQRHDRDIYTDRTPYVDDITTPTSGQSWKWYYNSPTDYGWTKIADSEAIKALQLAQMSVIDTDVLFIQTNSPTASPDLPTVNATTGEITNYKGWDTQAPPWVDGMYMWQTTYVRYGDGSATFSDPTCLTGATGPQGVPGEGYSNNLLLGTKDWSGWADGGYVAEGSYMETSVLHKNNIGVTGYYDITKTGVSLENGEIYTLSVWAKGSGTMNLYCYPTVTARILYTEDGESTSTADDTGVMRTLTSEWKRYFTVFRTKASADLTNKKVLFRSYSGSNAYFAGAKLEKGENLNPQWTPAASEMIGKTFYTWIRYADDSQGNGISNNPTGKEYIGFAYNKTTATESNNPADYKWSEIKGEQGVPGADGTQYYTWIQYSDNANGTPMYQQPTANTKYIGIAVNKTTATEGTNPADYTWSLFKGADGSPAKVVVVNADATAFTYADDFATLVGPTSIALSATLQGTSGYQWSYKVAGGSSFTNISGATSATYSLANNASIWGTAKSLTLRCTSGGVYDEITIVKVSSGSNGVDGAHYSPNLLLGTKAKLPLPDTDNSATTNYTTAVNSEGFLEETITAKSIVSDATQIRRAWVTNALTEYFKEGEIYTLSADVKSNVTGFVKISSRKGSVDNKREIQVDFPSTNGVWKRVHATAKLTGLADNNTALLVAGFPNGTAPVGSTVSVRKFCLTKGESAAYVPAESEMVGEDAYTVLLTNESHIFEGDTEKAVADSTECGVIAYKGATQVAATIGTITGMPTGMTVYKSDNGTISAKFTVNVTTSLTTKQGTLTVPVTVDGKTFTQVFSWSLSLKGDEGNGIDRIEEEYYLSTSRTALQGSSWSTTRQPWVAGRFYWTRSHVYYTDGTDDTYGEVCVTGESGAAAPNLVIEYSATGGSNASEWHPAYMAGDVWMRTSNDGGANFSAAVRIQGSGFSLNLLLGSKNGYVLNLTNYSSGSSYSSVVNSDGFLEFTMTANVTPTGDSTSGNNNKYLYIQDKLVEYFQKGETYTFSAEIKSTAPTLLYIDSRGGTGGTIRNLIIEVPSTNGVWKRVSVTKAMPTIGTNNQSVLCFKFTGGSVNSTASIRKICLSKGTSAEYASAASEVNGQWRKFQWALGSETAVTGTWQDAPMNAPTGQYVWMRSGIVVPPATTPATWETATRLTGDKGSTGDPGSSVYQLDLDNEIQPIACDASGNATYGQLPVTSNISVYKGGNEIGMSPSRLSIVQMTGCTAELVALSSSKSQLKVTAISADKAFVVVQASDTSIGVPTLQTTMNLYKVKPGANGAPAVIYTLDVSDNTISRNAGGQLSANTITVKKYKTTGSSRALTTEKYLFYQRVGVDANLVPLGSTSSSSGTITLSDDPAMTAVIVELRNTNSNSASATVLDRERIPVVSDGEGLTKNLVLDSEVYLHTNEYLMKTFTTSEDLVIGDTYTFTIWGTVADGNKFGIWDNIGSYNPTPANPVLIADGVYSAVVTWNANTSNSGYKANQFCIFNVPTGSGKEATIKRIKVEKGANSNPIYTSSPLSVDYVKVALGESGTDEGGLSLKTLIQCGYTKDGAYKVMSGVNGIAEPESAPAFWAGGKMLDITNPLYSALSDDDMAKYMMRHNGNGYMCGGTVRIINGEIRIGKNRDNDGNIKDDYTFSQDCMVLNEGSLEFYMGGQVRLKVFNGSVGSNMDAKTTRESWAPSIPATFGNVTLKHYKSTNHLLFPGVAESGTTTPQLSLTTYSWVPTSGNVVTKNIQIGSGPIAVGKTIEIESIRSSNFTINRDNNEGVQLTMRAELCYNTTINGLTAVRPIRTISMPLTKNGDSYRFYGAGLSHTVAVESTYFLRITLTPDTKPIGEPVGDSNKIIILTATSNGDIVSLNADYTLIGNDGIKSLWSNGTNTGGLLANKSGLQVKGTLKVNGKTVLTSS